MKSENFVYHYTKMEKAILILENMTLRMGSIEKVNDPKESTNRDFTFYIRNKKTSIFFPHNIFDDLEKDLTQSTFALCCVDSGIIKENNQHKNAMLPNLWAYYGENHSGVCLVINKDKLNEKMVNLKNENGNALYSGKMNYLDPEIWGSKVSAAYAIYLEDLLHDKNGYFEDHIKNNSEELFFTKQIAWRDELEFRWVARSRSAKDHIDIDLTDCLELVVIGSSATEKFEEKISILCQSIKCDHHKARWRTYEGVHKARHPDPHLDLDGIQYSVNVTSACVVVKAIDQSGASQPLHIDCSNGTAIAWGGDENDELLLRKRAKHLSVEWESCDEEQTYKPIFSASLLQKIPTFIEKDGKVICQNEEQPYYPDGFTYKPR